MRKTREIKVGDILLGGKNPVVVQTMCSSKTKDIKRTLEQIKTLKDAGAQIIRLAVDNKEDVRSLKEIRKETDVNLSVDLQENYLLAKDLAPFVQKIRYNPGHLYHIEKEKIVEDKVKELVQIAGENDCALRIGVNFGSLDPGLSKGVKDSGAIAIKSASEHVEYMEKLRFKNYVVSLKSSDPYGVIKINEEFSSLYPFVPLHLGVTEAGMLPLGEIKSRVAMEHLLSKGIGDTIRVSLTVPFLEKYREVEIGKQIIKDVANKKFLPKDAYNAKGLNIISCPSCSRVQTDKFIELAEKIKEATVFAKDKNLTVAVMGCRVNGPGESDDADIGMWCAPNFVNLKVKGELIGSYSYDEIVDVAVKKIKEAIL
ncbi:MAG: (E)-4-hydroxy-3-methylbut-2-enyl-diphosphate synthase [Bdellovibrionota bacterium]